MKMDVTEEMMDAGVDALDDARIIPEWLRSVPIEKEIVKAVFLAMLRESGQE